MIGNQHKRLSEQFTTTLTEILLDDGVKSALKHVKSAYAYTFSLIEDTGEKERFLFGYL